MFTLAATRVPLGPVQVLFASQGSKFREIVKKSLASTSSGTSTLFAKFLRLPTKEVDALVSLKSGRFGKDGGEDGV